MIEEYDDDQHGGLPECGMCGDDGYIMLSEAGPSEWGEDCFAEVDRPIVCPECRDRRRYEAQRANDQAQRRRQ
jgi:rubredoxin